MSLVIAGGLVSMAVVSGFRALWTWAKAATGVFILEAGLQVLSPFHDEATQAAAAVAASGAPDPAAARRLLTADGIKPAFLLAVSLANVALGIWRLTCGKSRHSWSVVLSRQLHLQCGVQMP